MAKGNVFLGTARGKIGDLVLFRKNGEQVNRVRVIPKNPQSDMQTLSRLALSTASKVATVLPFVNHSFQTVQYGQKSVNHFIKSAAKVLRSYAIAAYNGDNSEAAPILPFTSAGLGVAAPIVIASGDLTTGNLVPSLSGSVVKIGLTSPSLLTDDITPANFESIFGFPYTDQITFVVGMRAEDATSVESESVMAGIDFTVMRLNFKKDIPSTQILFTVDAGGIYTLVPGGVDEERSTPGITTSLTLVQATGVIVIGAFTGDTGAYTTASVIVSRYESGAWRRSTSALVQGAPDGITTTAQANTAFGWNYITDLLAISRKGSSVSEDRFLNKEKN